MHRLIQANISFQQGHAASATTADKFRKNLSIALHVHVHVLQTKKK